MSVYLARWKYFIFCIFLTTIFISPNSLANGTSLPQKEKSFSLGEVQEDYDLLIKLINSYHSKVFVKMDEFNDLASARRSLLHDGMNELEFYRVVSPLVSKLNCAHSSISLSNTYINNIFSKRQVFPLTIKLINNKIYVYKDYFNIGIPLGSEILNINGKDIKDIISVLLANVSSDGQNLTHKYYKINFLFAQLYYYYIDDSEEFVITYRNPNNGDIDKKSIPGVLLPKVFTKNQLPYKSPLDNQIINNNYAILKVPSFGFYKPEEIQNFKNYIDEFFKRIKEHKITNLILDLRYNKGGYDDCSTYLFSHLIAKQTPYFVPTFGAGNSKNDFLKIKPAKNSFKGNLYILINGGSYSATGLLCSVLKSNKIGIFIGEETGGSYICQGYTVNYKDFTLANTKLNLEISSRIYRTDVSGLPFGRGISPDYVVTPTIQEYLNGKDVELDFAIKLFKI